MTNKEKYREFCKKEKDIPIFSKDWWLDSVCGVDNWDVVLVEKGGQIWASWPYLLKKKFIFKISTMPPLTQTLGIYIKYPEGQKYHNKLSWEKEIINELIEKFPKVDFFSQNFHFSFTNWLPFYWKGFCQTTRYTYIIKDLILKTEEDILSNIDSSYRNKIKKASKTIKIKDDLNIDEFYEINKKTFLRQNLNIPYNFNFLKNHDEILKEKNRRKIFYAIDSNGNIHSSLYLTWDDFSSYVHMVGEDPELRKSGAGILLLFESIMFTKKVLKLSEFNFEGSMIENIEIVRRSFGAIQTPYFNISKINSKLLKIGKCFKGVFQ